MINNKKGNIFLKCLTVCTLSALVISACEQEDPNLIDYEEGTRLAISGPAEVRVGASNVGYYLLNNRSDADHEWTLDGGFNLTENSDNDAYVRVNEFTAPGTYEISVTRDNASGSRSIDVLSREVGFETASVQRMETNQNDTISIPLTIGGGFNNEATVSYSITGSMDEANYDVLAGYESPYTISTDTTAQIMLVIYPEAELNETVDLTLTIDDITSANDQEYAAGDTLQSITYEFADDLKTASMDTTQMEISEPGVYNIPVTLSNPAGGDLLRVNYSITTALGVSDATPTANPGTLRFEPGETEKEIVLSISELAFDNNQSITVSLQGLVSDDAEAGIDQDQNSKTIRLVAGN